MPRISGVLFLLAIAATWLESQEENQDEMNAFAVENYNRGFENGVKTQKEREVRSSTRVPKAK